MQQRYNTLTINGVTLKGDELERFCRERTPEASLLSSKIQDWERDMYAFILEWLDDSETVYAHTSGSTGVPKSICVKKESMIASAKLTGEYLGLESGQNALLCLWTNYIAGKMMVVRAFVLGLNLITVEPTGHPLNQLEQHIDFAAMVPLQVFNCIDDRVRLEQINHLIIGGGAVDNELLDKLSEVSTCCYSTYGMTETVSHVALKKLNGADKSDNYNGLGDVCFSTDSRGCLVIDAPDILEERLVTNDVVELVNDVEFKWLGRFDNVINSGGIKLMPEQLERKLSERQEGGAVEILKRLAETRFFFSGLPDARLENKLVMVIEGERWDMNSQKELQICMKQLLGKYEQPREILFVPSFAETQTGKVNRIESLKSRKV